MPGIEPWTAGCEGANATYVLCRPPIKTYFFGYLEGKIFDSLETLQTFLFGFFSIFPFLGRCDPGNATLVGRRLEAGFHNAETCTPTNILQSVLFLSVAFDTMKHSSRYLYFLNGWFDKGSLTFTSNSVPKP